MNRGQERSLRLGIPLVVAVAVVAISIRAHSPVASIQEPQALAPHAQVEHPPLAEMSGIVRSQTYPEVFWVHNDSGDMARLFAIRADGSVVMPRQLANRYFVGAEVAGKEPYPGIRIEGARNVDWEDIALGKNKRLYIGDVGNNLNARRDLGVYVLTEPEPEVAESAHVLQWLPIQYPDQTEFPGEQWHFDCEALFVYRGKLHFLTKHRVAGADLPEPGTKLYRLDTSYTDRANTLSLVDSKADLGGWVTAADVSPDEKLLAVLTHYPVSSIWLFELPAKDGKLLSGRARRFVFSGAKQCEAICFLDAHTLLVTNEQREIFRIPTSRFQEIGQVTPPRPSEAHAEGRTPHSHPSARPAYRSHRR